jgi:excisionase family DNA binding protein
MVVAWVALDNCLVRTTPSSGNGISVAAGVLAVVVGQQSVGSGLGRRSGSGLEKGPTVAAQRNGNASIETASYLRTAEVADILYVSPKTVARWAKEGKLPFMRTLGGHRRYPEAKIRELADELREEPTA